MRSLYATVVIALIMFSQVYSADYSLFTRQKIENGRWYLEVYVKRNNSSNTARFRIASARFKMNDNSGLDVFGGVIDESYNWRDLKSPFYQDLVITTYFTSSPRNFKITFQRPPDPPSYANSAVWPVSGELKIARVSMGIAYDWMKSEIGWYFPGGHIYASVTTSTGGVSSDYDFPAPDSTFALPVSITSFSGSLAIDKVILNWETATESNSYGFEIERSRQNHSWERIGFVAAKGTTTVAQDYTFMDKSLPAASELFYRLKLTDMDGSFEYSQVLKIPMLPLIDSPELEAIYPNPANQDMFVNFRLPRDAVISVTIFDSRGNEIRTLHQNELLKAGSYSRRLDISHLARGTYFIRLVSGNDRTVQRVFIRD